MSGLHLLLSFVRPYSRTAAMVLLAILIVTATGLLGPWLIGSIVRTVEAGDDTAQRQLLLIAGGLAVVYVARSVATGLVFHYSHVVAFSTVRDLRDALHAQLQLFSPAWFSARQSGDVVARVVRDTDELEPLLADAVYGFVVSGLLAIGVLVIMLGISPLLALCTFLPFPVAVWGVWKVGKRIRPAFDDEGELYGSVSALTQDHVAGMREIQIFNRETAEKQRYAGLSAQLANAQMGARRLMASFDPIVEGAAGLSTALVIAIGGGMAIRGELAVGDLVAFVLYIAAIYQPLHSVVDASEAFQRGLTSMKRAGEILSYRPEIDDPVDGVALPKAKGDIVLEGVSFSYPNSAIVLDAIDITLPAGTSLALVGPTGAGKTTLGNIVARFYDPLSGRVTLDGHDLRTIRLADLRRNISMVLQDVYLFNDTVRENIRFGRPGATDAEVEAAATAANADDFIAALPNGFDTIVGERGVRLSGGQKQRLSIARAILKDAPILILDEATSAVDSETEQAIQASLARLMQGRTSIVIAHRLSTIRNADQIVVLQNGGVAERGHHALLMGQNGVYARLVNAQNPRLAS